MREFRHVNIVRYIGAAVDEAEGVVNIFQEWVPGGSVAHMLKTFGPFPQRVVASYTRQILLGLSFLHKAGIIHRDIKGGNVLVHENGTVKVRRRNPSVYLAPLPLTFSPLPPLSCRAAGGLWSLHTHRL